MGSGEDRRQEKAAKGGKRKAGKTTEKVQKNMGVLSWTGGICVKRLLWSRSHGTTLGCSPGDFRTLS